MLSFLAAADVAPGMVVVDNGPKRTILFMERGPLVALDFWALRHLADDQDGLGTAFLNALGRHGTVCLSWMDVIEIGKVSGDTAVRIEAFLRSIGGYWVPFDCNPVRVQQRETDAAAAPWFCEPLAHALAKGTRGLDLTMAAVVGLLSDAEENCRGYQEVLGRELAPIMQILGMSKIGAVPEIKVPKDGSPTNRTWWALMQVIQKELAGPAVGVMRPMMGANDVIDFMRACVPMTYCDFVLLDKAWHERARKAKKVTNSTAKLYSGKQLHAFVSDFDAWRPE